MTILVQSAQANDFDKPKEMMPTIVVASPEKTTGRRPILSDSIPIGKASGT